MQLHAVMVWAARWRVPMLYVGGVRVWAGAGWDMRAVGMGTLRAHVTPRSWLLGRLTRRRRVCADYSGLRACRCP